MGNRSRERRERSGAPGEGEERGGEDGQASVSPRRGAPGEGEERGGEDGEGNVEVVKFMIDVDDSLFEHKDELHKIAETLFCNYMRYVITSLELVLHE